MADLRFEYRARRAWLAAIAVAAVSALGMVGMVRGQAPAGRPGADPAAPAAAATSGEGLDTVEARLAERYDRLELLAARLAEVSGGTQPRRAELLRQLVAQGRERDVHGQFDAVVAALADDSYSSAADGQAKLQADLEKLLELLLQEDRDRQLETERKRVMRYLQDLNKLIRLQRGVKARTDGGDDSEELADDQQRVGDDAGKLHDEMEEHAAEASDGAKGSAKEGDPKEGTPKVGEPKKGDGESPKSDDDKGSESDPSKGAPSGEQPPKKGEPGEQQPSGEPSQGQPSEGQPSEGQPSQGQPSEGQPSEGQPSEGQQSGEQQQSPMQKAAENLRRAKQRMEEAKKRLDQAKREGAAEEQKQAVEELEQAKAELEKILRQLREEELERMLVLLEARFRKMLDDQVEVYDETKKLDKASASAPEHEIEIASGRLSRKEKLIVRDADRALVLLREDGTSVAFPEAVEQARDDMQGIADRLNRVKTDLITQTMEEDVIASLEETLASLQQALEKLRDQKAQQGQGGGQPGEQPLVDQLAELRMIRALQKRVNSRTKQYGSLIQGEQAEQAELLEMLDELAIRQAKIFQATRDLETGNNQ